MSSARGRSLWPLTGSGRLSPAVLGTEGPFQTGSQSWYQRGQVNLQTPSPAPGPRPPAPTLQGLEGKRCPLPPAPLPSQSDAVLGNCLESPLTSGRQESCCRVVICEALCAHRAGLCRSWASPDPDPDPELAGRATPLPVPDLRWARPGTSTSFSTGRHLPLECKMKYRGRGPSF